MKHSPHTFHIPVMGLAFTVDTPVKVARYGISSVISILDDQLLEDMRMYYSGKQNVEYIPITNKDDDYRARRITAYLNLVQDMVDSQWEKLMSEVPEDDGDLKKYLDLLPDDSEISQLYEAYQSIHFVHRKEKILNEIKSLLVPGQIDVNIMTKVDKKNYGKEGEELPSEYSDALAALRGFANSRLRSSVVFSAGINPRLYSYAEKFADFFPDENGELKKRIVLKVSDYRSALVQSRFLAKKGLWVSEFRIESGLNCGGHAFATEGYLLGPILEEFKNNLSSLRQDMFQSVSQIWTAKGINVPANPYEIRLTVQGGIGTSNERKFLIENYGVASTGWGTPFLLVPEATTVDEETLKKLVKAKQEDLYLSDASPLGVPFNNLRHSASENRRVSRIAAGRPGSPCIYKYLVANSEFTTEPICTASRQYQNLKITQIKQAEIEEDQKNEALEKVIVKSCICNDLAASAYLTTGIKPKQKPAPAICPGPNLAYFSDVFSLREMVNHIYGRISILNEEYRPNFLMAELKMYIDHFIKELNAWKQAGGEKKLEYLRNFRTNLRNGIAYYKHLIPQISCETRVMLNAMRRDLAKMEFHLAGFHVPEPAVI